MPGFSLTNSLKSNLQSAVVSSVSNSIGAAVPGLGGKLINTALSGGSIKGALLGAATGALGNELLGGIQNKLGGLIANAEELTGLANNPLKIVERGLAELSGITGEADSLIQSQYLDELKKTDFGAEFINNTFTNSFNDKSSDSKIPNPLRDHNSFNYKITLGVLDAAEYNNPEIYRSTGFKNFIVQSSGGGLEKRYQVFDETGAGKSEHAEYYIDDIEFESLISPNPNTRVTPGATMNFTITEPYSMGNFIQAVIGSAREAGYSGYNHAPFCIRIDFVGWNLDGQTDANFLLRPMFIPIQIINMDFNVSGKGSVYQVSAVPMSETGLADNINKIKNPVKATGLRLHEVLETNDTSVSAGVNSQIEALEEAGTLAPYDRYVICFPKDRASIQNALKSKVVQDSAFTTTAEEREEQRAGFNLAETNPALRAAFNPTVITITPPNNIYAILKTFAEDTNLMNAIGLSTLNEDTNAPGNSAEADASQVINPETGIVDTASIAAQPADKARDFQFSQGEQITTIIEKLVLQSTYAAERATEGATNGLNKWFKIDTHVYLGESPLTEAQLGRRPKIYVYSIMPYEVPEAVHISGDRKSSNIQGLKNSASKVYNYIYSGKNEDVLNFDLTFNQSFLLAATSDFGSTPAAGRDPDAGSTALTQQTGDKATAAALPTGTGTNDDTPAELGTGDISLRGGGHNNDVRRQIAEIFHDTVTKLPVDMVQAEMEIMGDPYFIPQETGNYVARRGKSPTITDDGTMAYMTGPVFANVYFRSPFDYQVTGATMEMPLVVPGFSGLFQIWAATSKFSGGKFTQTLKMIRMRGQEDESSHTNSGSILPDNTTKTGPATVQSDGTVGQSGQPSTDCMPAPTHDDIRRINPAIGADVAAQLSAPFDQLADQLAAFGGIGDQFSQAVKGVDFGIAAVPDLTKIIPRIANPLDAFGGVGAAIGGANPLDAFGGVGAAIGGANPLDAFGGVGAAVNSVSSRASSAVNTAANQGVAAISSRTSTAAADLNRPMTAAEDAQWQADHDAYLAKANRATGRG
jgi:hypothetical protein